MPRPTSGPHRHRQLSTYLVAFDCPTSACVWPAASQQRGAAGHAQSDRDVGALEDDAAGSQSFNVWRVHVGAFWVDAELCAQVYANTPRGTTTTHLDEGLALGFQENVAQALTKGANSRKEGRKAQHSPSTASMSTFSGSAAVEEAEKMSVRMMTTLWSQSTRERSMRRAMAADWWTKIAKALLLPWCSAWDH